MTVHDDQQKMSEAWTDLMYAVFSACGIVWLVKRLGLELKDKYREAEIRAKWRK